MSKALEGQVIPPPPATPPMPAAPPSNGGGSAPPPPSAATPPAGPTGGGDQWCRNNTSGGGIATAPPPVVAEHAPPREVVFMTPQVTVVLPGPAAPARFSLARIRPLYQGTAAFVGLLLTPITNGILQHQVHDWVWAVPTGLVGAVLVELRCRKNATWVRWAARAVTFNMLWAIFLTEAGRETVVYVTTGIRG